MIVFDTLLVIWVLWQSFRPSAIRLSEYVGRLIFWSVLAVFVRFIAGIASEVFV